MFQASAFQPTAFAVAITVAFQPGAFQAPGFQTDYRAPVVTAVETPSGGLHWSVRYERELAKRLRKRIQQDEDEEAVEAALEASGVALPESVVDPQADDLARVRGLVRAYASHFEAHTNRTQRALDYAVRAKSEMAYALALREIAKELEEEEHAILLTLAML